MSGVSIACGSGMAQSRSVAIFKLYFVNFLPNEKYGTAGLGVSLVDYQR